MRWVVLALGTLLLIGCATAGETPDRDPVIVLRVDNRAWEKATVYGSGGRRVGDCEAHQVCWLKIPRQMVSNAQTSGRLVLSYDLLAVAGGWTLVAPWADTALWYLTIALHPPHSVLYR